jgi:hypothetical protein
MEPPESEARLLRGVSGLRWRRRLFLLGPPLAFGVLQAIVFHLHAVVTEGRVTDGVVLLAGAGIALTAGWIGVCLWWAPAATCPKCRTPMGGRLLSAHNVLWVWMKNPRCPRCAFTPFKSR